MRYEKVPCVYILASGHNGTLYVGVTGDPWARIPEHKQGEIEGFTKRYRVSRLVYYEMHETMDEAIRREKLLKKWHRAWKLRLIEQMNPEWADLFDMSSGELLEGSAYAERLQAEPIHNAGRSGPRPSPG
jgi:putative endonuclease